jgi:hypothetical protein
MSIEVVKIQRQATGEIVDAQLRDDLGLADLNRAERKWKFERYRVVMELIQAGARRDQMPEHWHWDWAAKFPKAGTVGVRLFGIECEGDWQGLMMTTSVGHNARLAPDLGKPIAYVKYIESAPWNVKGMTPSPKFSAVGARLIEAAVRQSMDDGLDGRLGLHSLSVAERFYERLGFVNLGLDASVEDLAYCELTASASLRILNGGLP